MDAGLLGPAISFVGFAFEFCDRFHRITGWHDLCVVGVELVSCRRGAGQIPVAFFIEAVGDGFDGIGQEIVVIGDGEGEARFDCVELS